MSEETVNAMLAECIDNNDVESAKSIESIARADQAPLKDSTWTLLIKSLGSRPWRARPLVKEALWRDTAEFSEELALVIIAFCAKTSDKAMADRLFQQMATKSWNVLAAFVSFYAVGKHCEEAVDILEHNLPSFNGDYLQHPLTSFL